MNYNITYLSRIFAIIIITLSGGTTSDAFISTGNTSALGSCSRSPSSRRCIAIRCSAAAVPFPSFPLTSSRGWHSFQHLLHAGKSRSTNRSRSGFPAKRVFRHFFQVIPITVSPFLKSLGSFALYWWLSDYLLRIFRQLRFFFSRITIESRCSFVKSLYFTYRSQIMTTMSRHCFYRNFFTFKRERS